MESPIGERLYEGAELIAQSYDGSSNRDTRETGTPMPAGTYQVVEGPAPTQSPTEVAKAAESMHDSGVFWPGLLAPEKGGLTRHEKPASSLLPGKSTVQVRGQYVSDVSEEFLPTRQGTNLRFRHTSINAKSNVHHHSTDTRCHIRRRRQGR